QPRIQGAGRLSRFRHYLNLARTAPRLDQLLRDFAWGRVDQVFPEVAAPPACVVMGDFNGILIRGPAPTAT
ncbi:MAG TPA: DUF3473 domain-containing protein, partial [Spirochaetales bacterium]|nr:DUF3473 domain-containing protein [Spirochaetales bacterium]